MYEKGNIVIANERAIKEYNVPSDNRIGVMSECRVQALDSDWSISGSFDFSDYFYTLSELENKVVFVENMEKTNALLFSAIEALVSTNKLLREGH